MILESISEDERLLREHYISKAKAVYMKRNQVVYLVVRGRDDYISGFLYPAIGDKIEHWNRDYVKVTPELYAHFGKVKQLAYMWTEEKEAEKIANRINDAFVVSSLVTRGPLHGILKT